MPAKDIFHNIVVTALQKDGWIITDDPLRLKWGLRELFVDLGAKKLIAAQKGETKREQVRFVRTSELTKKKRSTITLQSCVAKQGNR